MIRYSIVEKLLELGPIDHSLVSDVTERLKDGSFSESEAYTLLSVNLVRNFHNRLKLIQAEINPSD